jgi:hypothetical protein
MILLILAAVGLISSGIGLLFKQDWWQPVLIGAGAFSSLSYLLLWNGRFHHLDHQGAVGILINLIIITALVMFNWPSY